MEFEKWIKSVYRTTPSWIKRYLPFEGQDREILERFGKNFSIGIFGSVASLLIGLGRTAVLTKSLTVASYGSLLIVLNLFTVLNNFLSIRVADAIYRFFPEFKEQDDDAAVRALFYLSLFLSLAIGLLVGGGVLVLAPWIADRFYDNPSLAPAFRIYAGASVLLAFEMLYTSILRLEDRFSAIVVPNVLAGGTQLVLLGIYFFTADAYQLAHVVSLLAVGVLVRTVPPLVMAVRTMWPVLRRAGGRPLFRALQPYREGVTSTLVQTNLMGYLKVASTPGDLFLLGVFATPEQVGYYGLARRLLRPLAQMLQRNVKTAVEPEIVSLWAKQQFRKMKRLIEHFVKANVAVGGLALIVGSLTARPVILLVSRPEYLAALPVFYVLLVSRYIAFACVPFYPASVAMNMLGRRNVLLAGKIALMGGALLVGLNALVMAFVQLTGSVSFRLFHDWPLYKRLRRRTRDQNDEKLHGEQSPVQAEA